MRIKTLLRDHDWQVLDSPVPLDAGYSEVGLLCGLCGEHRVPLIGCGLTVDRPELRPGCARPFSGRYEPGDCVLIPGRHCEQRGVFQRYSGDALRVRPGGSDPEADYLPEQVRPCLAVDTS